LSEHRHVPEVDNEKSNTTREEKGEGKDAIVKEALVVHPNNNEHPDEEGENVKISIVEVLYRVLGCVCDDVENSSFVEDCIDLSNKAEHSKPYSLICEESTSKTDDDHDVMDHQHAGVKVDEHIYSLCNVNPQREDDQMSCSWGVGQHEIRAH